LSQRACPQCSRAIPADSLVCPYCRAQLASQRLCWACAKRIPSDALTCPYCSAQVRVDAGTARRRWPLAVGGIAILIGIAFGGTYYYERLSAAKQQAGFDAQAKAAAEAKREAERKAAADQQAKLKTQQAAEQQRKLALVHEQVEKAEEKKRLQKEEQRRQQAEQAEEAEGQRQEEAAAVRQFELLISSRVRSVKNALGEQQVIADDPDHTHQQFHDATEAWCQAVISLQDALANAEAPSCFAHFQTDFRASSAHWEPECLAIVSAYDRRDVDAIRQSATVLMGQVRTAIDGMRSAPCPAE
jgi:RNA polymerase subunit RPABC4/transcription elongation factor Spt4